MLNIICRPNQIHTKMIKNLKKRITSLFLILSLMVSAVSCSSSTKNETSSESADLVQSSISNRNLTVNDRLNVKYPRNSESDQMIDLLRKTILVDFAAMYSQSVDNITHFFRQEMKRLLPLLRQVLPNGKKSEQAYLKV